MLVRLRRISRGDAAMKNKLEVLSLFSGIGGFDLGLEATEFFSTKVFVEIDQFCQKVLRKHWPLASIYKDIRRVRVNLGDFDVFVGGFPCQDLSVAGLGAGLVGDRSSLWFEYYRLIKEGKPNWIVIENVEALLNRGMGVILTQLAAAGYDAEWRVIRAADVGFPHIRKRIWIIAHSNSHRLEGGPAFPLQGLREVPWRALGRSAANWAGERDPAAPRILGRDHGIPNYVDRVNSIGNSVVPLIPYYIGMAIAGAEGYVPSPR